MVKRTVSGIMLTLLLTGILTLAVNVQPAKASGTIYIRADGSIDPPTAPILNLDNITYTFADNISGSIVVERDNIIVDGVGYTLEGQAGLCGICLSERHNITVKNIEIKSFTYGIYATTYVGPWLNSSKIIGNKIMNNEHGLYFIGASYNTISNNNITANNAEGIYLDRVLHINVTENSITQNGYGVYCWGPMGAGSYIIVSRNNITSNANEGMRLYGVHYSVVSGNSITANNLGCEFEALYYSTISGNAIVANNFVGLRLGEPMDAGAYFNNVTGNMIANNGKGIESYKASHNIVSGNWITANTNGFFLESMEEINNNQIFENDITNNENGIWMQSSSGNSIYHNNFENNTKHVTMDPLDGPSVNAWDDGCEGNYWSDYNGTDLDSDGIGDTTYIIDENNADNYPLMNLYWNPADVDHDLDVDLYDAVRLLAAYGCKIGDKDYNPHCDIAEPYGIINLFDAVALLLNYGKKYP